MSEKNFDMLNTTEDRVIALEAENDRLRDLLKESAVTLHYVLDFCEPKRGDQQIAITITNVESALREGGRDGQK